MYIVDVMYCRLLLILTHTIITARINKLILLANILPNILPNINTIILCTINTLLNRSIIHQYRIKFAAVLLQFLLQAVILSLFFSRAGHPYHDLFLQPVVVLFEEFYVFFHVADLLPIYFMLVFKLFYL